MRQAIRLLPLTLLALLAGQAAAETLQTNNLCQPSHVTVAALRENGFAVVDSWVDDYGFPVEIWSDGRDGRAIVVLAQADNGALLRCLLASHSPAPSSKS